MMMATVLGITILWRPRNVHCLTPNLPPLPEGTRGGATNSSKNNKKPTGSFINPTRENKYHTSDFGARQNHPTSYDPSPLFLGPIQLERRMDDAALDDTFGAAATITVSNSRSFNTGRVRIRHYYERQNLPLSPSKPLKSSAPTKQKLKAIVDHLAYHNAPVDVKEVCESVEFVLRTRKRLLGAAKQQQKSHQQQQQQREPADASRKEGTIAPQNPIHLFDLCCGHGLTGMLFCCCGSGSADTKMTAILVDQTQPPSHAILLELLTQVCPWLGEEPNAITYQEARLDSATTLAGLSSSLTAAEPASASQDNCKQEDKIMVTNLVISTHACGALTDRVLELAASHNTAIQDTNTNPQSATKAAAVAVMPCCYTGTSQGAPYGIQRALGVAWAADIQRSYYLKSQGYHTDFATIPREITPMNRILIGEFKGSTQSMSGR